MDYQENDLPNASRANMDTTSFFNLQKMDTLLTQNDKWAWYQIGFYTWIKVFGI